MLFYICNLDGDAQDEDSSDSDLEDQSNQDLKPKQSLSGSTAHRTKSSRAAWCVEGEESKRWADQLSLDEKDGFVFVNYSEGQPKLHSQSQHQPQVQSHMQQPHQQSLQNDIRLRNQLRQGNCLCSALHLKISL